MRLSNGDTVRTVKAKSVWIDSRYDTAAGARDMAALDIMETFQNPKPVAFIEDILRLGAHADGLILDFFAGSGTTAQAVLELNAKDGGHRKFILVQLPEPTGREDYPTIADITKERVRRVIKKLGTDDGFRVFKLAESNFTAWDSLRRHSKPSHPCQRKAGHARRVS